MLPMMTTLFSLHALAAQRGEGLRPEFLALSERLAAASVADPIATELGRHQADCMVPSGPHPVPAEGAAPPQGVLRFPTDRRSDRVPEADCPVS